MTESGKRPAQTPECLTIGSRHSAQSGTSCVCFKSGEFAFWGCSSRLKGVTKMSRNAPPNAQGSRQRSGWERRWEKVVSNLKRWSMFGLKRALSAEIGVALHAL